jgi:hypothetical protein
MMGGRNEVNDERKTIGRQSNGGAVPKGVKKGQNGHSERIHFYQYCLVNKITFTRGRKSKKNESPVRIDSYARQYGDGQVFSDRERQECHLY